jgi:hypothetical protein
VFDEAHGPLPMAALFGVAACRDSIAVPSADKARSILP